MSRQDAENFLGTTMKVKYVRKLSLTDKKLLRELYNIEERKLMCQKQSKINDKLDENLVNRMLKKYPGAYVPEYDEKSGLPILPKSEYKDWEY